MKKINKILLGLSLAFAVGMSAMGGALFSRKAQASVWSESTVKTEYYYGETLSLPTRTVTVGGKTVEANAVVVFPDGTARLVKELTLDVVGQYTISYTATVDGQTYLDEDSFCVVH